MTRRPALFEVFETGSAFRLWHTENNVCQCLSCQGEGYSWSGSRTFLTNAETNNEEQLWVITSFTEDGNAFKIANVKHGLFLCAHGRLAGPILFCHQENGESDQAWLCLPTGQDRFHLNNVSVGKVANGSWHVEHVRTFAGFSQTPVPTTPAAGSDTLKIAAAAGAAGAVLGAAAIVVGASLLASNDDENRTRNANDRRRDVQRLRDQDGKVTLTDHLHQLKDVTLDLKKTFGKESIRGSSAGGERRLLLHSIRFTQDSVASQFQDGRSLEETVSSLRSGKMAVDDLPAIRVVEYMNYYWSLDNRRLSCMQEAFPERRHADKAILVKMEVLSDPKVNAEFNRKFTTGTQIVKRNGSSKS